MGFGATIARTLTLTSALATLTFAAPAHAQAPPPTLRGTDVSPYEQETIDAALAHLQATREGDAEGKVVEGVDIITLDVIEERDPVPRFLNVFHWTTKSYVIDREVLVRPGAPYKQVLVDESVRNLRGLPALSLVLAVPTKGSAAGGVRIVIITKDIWSLRLNQNWAASSGGLEELTLQPSEINAFGTQNSASLLFDLLPLSLTLGGAYRMPRLAGTRITLNASANVVINRDSGNAEGTYGQLLTTQPLYSALREWGWSSRVSWSDVVTRRYVNAHEALYTVKGAPPGDTVPWEYRSRVYSAQESITRSFGWETKHDVSLGGGFDSSNYRAPFIAGADPVVVSSFATKQMPRSDVRVGPFVQYHGYTTRFVRLLDFQTLGLQEDYRLGHDVYVRVYPVLSALGSSRDFLGVYAGAQYTVPIRDGLASALVSTTTEGTTERINDGALIGDLQLVSPRTRFGRIVWDGRVLSRYRNYLNVQTSLGGNTRLRGYPTSFLIGKDFIASNLEFRTRPIEILSCELGAAVFYDVGDAFDGFENMHPKQGAGVGVRILFPQLDRLVLRTDLGFPLGQGARIPGVAPASFFFAFEQAFGMPGLTTAALPSGP